MNKLFFCLLLWAASCLALNAQIRLNGYHQRQINPALLDGRWPARWLSVPGEPANAYGVYHFRKNFSLADKPEHFLVHVTADNRYKLYVNGQFVSLGPARGDVYNWNFETVDLASYLQAGKNVLAAVVWNFAEWKPIAQMSINQTGFLLQGNTEAEAVVNTDNSWLCLKNKSYSPLQTGVLGYYAAGAGETMVATDYPWGWESPSYDDKQWQKAHAGIDAAAKGARDYPGRLLVPTPIPPMELRTERFKEVRLTEGIERMPQDFLKAKTSLVIPAHSKAKLLLDNHTLTTGYLSLLFSGGKAAEITLTYAEALYEGVSGAAKGNRDEVKGKRMVGYQDRVKADGGAGRSYTTLWWRTWRYVEVSLATADEPLTLNDIYGTFCAYPFTLATRFEAPGHEELGRMLEIGWRTARLCANETYMDCPYYEQLQYFGDTRIQAMISLYNTRDTCMVKNALEQGRQSIVADGITMSRYPSYVHQFISSFSLWWICMGYDYWMYRGDEAYLKTLLPAYRGVLAWYESQLKSDHSLGYVPHWFFADWANGLPAGEPVREKDGNSAFQDVMYLLTLDAAARMERAFGLSTMGDHYAQVAAAIRAGFRDKYWDEGKGLFADTHDHRSFSQHVNSLAILAGLTTGSEATQVMRRTLTDTSLIQATIYFRYYVHRALQAASLGNELLDNLQIWRTQLTLGLTTWAEKPEPSRSDCHAWGASPSIEFFRILLGIDSDAPGFARIRIAPSLCGLKEVSGSMPHPAGTISVSYKVNKKGKLTAHFAIPHNVPATFVWKGQTYHLKDGEQTLTIDE